jgi:hypothetical protein
MCDEFSFIQCSPKDFLEENEGDEEAAYTAHFIVTQFPPEIGVKKSPDNHFMTRKGYRPCFVK